MKTGGSFQIAARLRLSWKVPWLAAPSPKKQTATPPVPSVLAVSAAPQARGKPPPTMPLAPSIPLSTSALCMEPPLPLHDPDALPMNSATRPAMSSPWRCSGRGASIDLGEGLLICLDAQPTVVRLQADAIGPQRLPQHLGRLE